MKIQLQQDLGLKAQGWDLDGGPFYSTPHLWWMFRGNIHTLYAYHAWVPHTKTFRPIEE